MYLANAERTAVICIGSEILIPVFHIHVTLQDVTWQSATVFSNITHLVHHKILEAKEDTNEDFPLDNNS